RYCKKRRDHRNYELQVILLLLLEVAVHKGSTRANTYPVVIQSLLVQTDDGVLNYTLLFLNRNQDTFFPSYPQLSFQLLEQLAHYIACQLAIILSSYTTPTDFFMIVPLNCSWCSG